MEQQQMINAIETEYDRYERTGETDNNVYLQLITADHVENKANKGQVLIPAHVWVTKGEAAWIRANMARLAKLGVIAAIGSTLYQDLRGGNQQAA